MRLQTLVFIFLLPLFAWSEPKQISDFFTLSKKLRTELKSEKSQTTKAAKLKELEEALNSTQKEYEKLNPEKGDDKEKKVSFFYFTFEPLFETKKFDKKGCEHAEYQVTYEDKMGRAENEALTPDAQEALEWVKLLCQ